MIRSTRWNDYYRVARMYLQNYTFYKRMEKRLEREIAEAQNEADAIQLPGGVASAMGGEKNSSTSAVERGVYRRIKLMDSADRLEENLILLEGRIAAIDDALWKLDDESRQILTLFHIDNHRFTYIANKMHLSESWCKVRAGKATTEFCENLFGDIAREPVCFLKLASGGDAQSEEIYARRAARRRKRAESKQTEQAKKIAGSLGLDEVPPIKKAESG